MFFHFSKNVFLLLVSVVGFFLGGGGGGKNMDCTAVACSIDSSRVYACSYIQTIATQYRCTTIVGTVIVQRPSQTTARQYGQRLQVIGIHRKRGGC